MPPLPAPARLHVLFAREAPVGVVFRRGPSKQVRLILWRTSADTFEPGQWFKGRIYAERAALSPNGELLAYLAADWRVRQWQTEDCLSLSGTGCLGTLWDLVRRSAGALRTAHDPHDAGSTWLAISRPPYLTALALWQATGTYGGRAAFPDNRTVFLEGTSAPVPTRRPPDWLRVQELPAGWDRWRARGWRPSAETRPWTERKRPTEESSALSRALHRWIAADLQPPMARDKPVGGERILLRYHRHGWDWSRFKEIESYALIDRLARRERDLDVEQAEVDPTGRLILVRSGKLFAAKVEEDLAVIETELADFNALHFEPVPPPGWATTWPSPGEAPRR